MKIVNSRLKQYPSLQIKVIGALMMTANFLAPVTLVHADDDDHKVGIAVYKKANCLGCHKWHGGGGGGYGGSAKSLRETTLDENGLTILIRCGRPATGMPYHLRTAYKGDNEECYGTTGAALGDSTPPRARTFLRDPEVEAVVAYVLNKIKGQGEPTKEDCFAFWGDNAKQCNQ